jgi:hypothetical protein
MKWSEEELERLAELYDEGNIGQKTYAQIAEELNEEFHNNKYVRNTKSVNYGIKKAIDEGYL